MTNAKEKELYAFPDNLHQTGMTLRDWYKGQALCGYLASYAAGVENLPSPDNAVTVAAGYADAMMKEREKNG